MEGYTAWSVTVGEQPTTAYWNILGSNDASFNTGTGFNNDIILWRHIENDMIPTGVIQMWGGSTTPSSAWLLCNGAAISRTTYPVLFTVIGTLYGAGDGSTTFNVPNLQGNVPVGLSSSDPNFETLGQVGGEDAHTLSWNEMPVHSHGVYDPGHSHGTANNYMEDAGGAGNQGTNTPGNRFIQGLSNVQVYGAGTGIGIYNAGGGWSHNNLQPYLVLSFIIKT
jgi:microcystin-dependent protein